MSTYCTKLRRILAAHGPQALRSDTSAQEHLVECSECFAFLEALAELEQAFSQLPETDAPDELVEELLARPELVVAAHTTPPTDEELTARTSPLVGLGEWLRHLLTGRHLVWMGAAVPVVLVVVFFGSMLLQRTGFRKPLGAADYTFRVEESREQESPELRSKTEAKKDLDEGFADDKSQVAPGKAQVGGLERDALRQAVPESSVQPLQEPAVAEEEAEVAGGELRSSETWSDQVLPQAPFAGRLEAQRGAGADEPAPPARRAPRSDREVAKVRAPEVGLAANEGAGKEKVRRSREESILGTEQYKPAPQVMNRTGEELHDEIGDATVDGLAFRYISPTSGDERKSNGPASLKKQGAVGAKVDQPRVLSSPAPELPAAARAAGIEGTVVLECTISPQGTVTAVKVLRPLPLGMTQAALAAVKQWLFEPVTREGVPVESRVVVPVRFQREQDQETAAEDASLAHQFLAERDRVDDLTFVPARGYWSNTYVPGDRDVRALQARLMGWDRSALAHLAPQPLELHDASHKITQPFDTPDNAAMAVYLHADRRAVSARSRVLLQVGLQGTARRSGRRSRMNIGVLLDLRGQVPSDDAAAMRALVEAFVAAKDLGDRLCLSVAGRPGGVVVPPQEFRYGPVSLALASLLTQAPAAGSGLSLPDALAATLETVGEQDDPNAPLGSSVVIIVSTQRWGRDADVMARQALRSAVGGIPVSVVGIGDGVDLGEIDRVVLAGQGNRRLLSDPAQASNVVDQELTAVSRVVARAVRLRIRLAPGVQLVDVVDSSRLDERQSQQVRDAETSIDQRLSRTLGIAADRGNDEEGIQIVIPTFYANDSHVVLLDLVTPGPGPLADVSVRYKDLVFSRNGVARDSLSLARGERPAGPLERNVLKNLLASRLSEHLDQAADNLQAGEVVPARQVLEQFKSLLLGLRHEVPGLANDADLAHDIAMLEEYLALLEAWRDDQPDQRRNLADSLRYAARLKLVQTLSLDGQ